MFSSTNEASADDGFGGGEEIPRLGAGIEIRPGGLLVQQRNSDTERSSVCVPNIRVRVKYGSTYHDIYISSQASFGMFLICVCIYIYIFVFCEYLDICF